MLVNILPTFQCNQKCSYCFLKGLSNNNLLDLTLLRERLEQVKKYFPITDINIYGGEITLLSKTYVRELIELCKLFTNEIGITTNLSNPSFLYDFQDVHWGTSINDERPNNELVKTTLLMLPFKLTLNIVVLPSVIKKGAEQVIKECSVFSSSIAFIRYYPTILNPTYSITEKDYENFLIDALKVKTNVTIINKDELRDCIENRYNPYCNSHLFILPDATFNKCSYKEHLEYFETIQIENYSQIAEKERNYAITNCKDCRYMHRCYAEHFREGICQGNRNLLNYYETHIYKTN